MIQRRYQRILLLTVVGWVVLYFGFDFSDRFNRQLRIHVDDVPARAPKSDAIKAEEKELVVASLMRDRVKWLNESFPTWKRNVYVVDKRDAELTVPKNKGREAMVFLTYIIDRYDTLPDVSIFIHSLRYQWHNEDPMYDGVPVLQHLRLSHVKARGYVSLRCTWTMGCPSELHPLNPSNSHDDRSQNERAYADAFHHFFPDKPVPATIGAHCCSQFAVSRDRIRSQPKALYEKIRNWLLDTELSDQISGRVIEYMWHIIFGMPAVDCQDAGECFCETFGYCNLTCKADACEKRYHFPRFATLPEGWPEEGPGRDGWPEKGWAD